MRNFQSSRTTGIFNARVLWIPLITIPAFRAMHERAVCRCVHSRQTRANQETPSASSKRRQKPLAPITQMARERVPQIRETEMNFVPCMVYEQCTTSCATTSMTRKATERTNPTRWYAYSDLQLHIYFVHVNQLCLQWPWQRKRISSDGVADVNAGDKRAAIASQWTRGWRRCYAR